MNGYEAHQLDKQVATPYYADHDSDSGLWCVFGSESGFAYSSHTVESDAQESADRRNEIAKQRN